MNEELNIQKKNFSDKPQSKNYLQHKSFTDKK